MSAKPNDDPAAAVADLVDRWLPRVYRGYAIAVGLCLAGAFAESFANQIAYFRHQGYPLVLAWIAPTMIDIFIIGGETLVLIATVKGWERRYKVAGWAAAAAGLAVSVAANVGKDGWTVPGTRRLIPPELIASHAVPPLALAGLLALGLAIVKRALHPPAKPAALDETLARAVAAFRGELVAGQVPAIRAIKPGMGVGTAEAQRVRAFLGELAPLLAPPPPMGPHPLEDDKAA